MAERYHWIPLCTIASQSVTLGQPEKRPECLPWHTSRPTTVAGSGPHLVVAIEYACLLHKQGSLVEQKCSVALQKPASIP